MKAKFLSYHPYQSFSTGKIGFVTRDGKAAHADTDSDDNALELWQLGRDAFAPLPLFQNIQEFDDYYKNHLDGIAALADVLQNEGSRFNFQTPDGRVVEPNFAEFSSSGILNVYWNLPTNHGKFFEPLAHHFLFACLEEIDSALIGLALDSPCLSAVISAGRCLANYEAVISGNAKLQEARSALAMHAAKERYANDAKQTERKFVHECWKRWQANPSAYDGKAAFARDMISKCEHLVSMKNIENWCRKWETDSRL